MIAICSNNSILGVDIADKQYKISLFADDLLFHTTNPLKAFSFTVKGIGTYW